MIFVRANWPFASVLLDSTLTSLILEMENDHEARVKGNPAVVRFCDWRNGVVWCCRSIYAITSV